MSWDFCKQAIKTARKEYRCEAYDAICNSNYGHADFSPEDWATIKKAEAEGCNIFPGTKYLSVKGIWEGDWGEFKARLDLDDICRRLGFYGE